MCNWQNLKLNANECKTSFGLCVSEFHEIREFGEKSSSDQFRRNQQKRASKVHCYSPIFSWNPTHLTLIYTALLIFTTQCDNLEPDEESRSITCGTKDQGSLDCYSCKQEKHHGSVQTNSGKSGVVVSPRKWLRGQISLKKGILVMRQKTRMSMDEIFLDLPPCSFYSFTFVQW